MIRKLVIVFYVLFFTILFAELSQIRFYNFISGLNTKWAVNTVPDGQCIDVNNLLFDKKLGLIKRDGYSLQATINSVGDYINGIEFTRSTGDKYYVLQKGSSLYKSPDLASWTTFETGLTTTYDCRFVVYLDDLWRTNGNNNVAFYDNTSLTAYSFIPKGRFIAVYNESIFIGNTTDESSGLYFSDISLGAKSPTAWNADNAFYVGRNDGDNITGLYVWNGILWIFKKNSIWGVAGYSVDDYTLRQYTDEFGCIDDRTIKVKNNALIFLSGKGLIAFDGSSAAIISKLIEPSINNLSLNSRIERNWTQSSQSDFALGTANNVDITTYAGEIRNSTGVYKLWTSSKDFSDNIIDNSVNIDTFTFARNGLICNDVRTTEDFTSGVISSSWTIIQNTNFPNSGWNASNFYLMLSSGGSVYNGKGTLYFNNFKDYGKRKWEGEYKTGYNVWVMSDVNLQADNKTYLGLVLYCDTGSAFLYENNTAGSINAGAIQNFIIPSGLTYSGLNASTHTFFIGKDYDGKYNLTVDGKEWERGTIDNTPVYSAGIPLTAFRLEEIAQYTSKGQYDNFGIYTSTYAIYISSWDTTIANPIWEIFTSSIATYGIGDIGFQTRVSDDGSTWDAWIGISSGQTPASASKRYIQFKATTTVNTFYEVKSPEIMEVYISRNASGTFTSQDKYAGTSLTSWGPINIDDTDNIGYFVSGATSSYNLSIASYIPVSDGQTIPLNPSANYVKWRSTYTSSVSQITYGVTLHWNEGTGATGSQRYASCVFDDRYWLSCSSNNSTNDIIYAADSNTAFTRFSNIPANILFEFNNKKYFASSKDNNIFEFNEINTDSGTAINSYWKSGFTYLGDTDVYKWLRYAFFTGKKNSGDFVYFDYSIDNSTITYTDYVSFNDNQNIPKEFGEDKKGKNFYFSIRSTGTFELQGFAIHKENFDLNPLIP